MLTPTVTPEQMVDLVHEGLQAYRPGSSAVYIRPMYWGIDGDATAIVPQENSTGFAICLEEIPMAPETASATLTYHAIPPPGSGIRRRECQGRVPLPQQRPDAALRRAPKGSRTRWLPTRWAMWPKPQPPISSWSGTVRSLPPSQRHLSGRDHPRPPHQEPARRWRHRSRSRSSALMISMQGG